ncbi:MAG: class I SAM-dependent methyltransferase [Candidatus Kapaibacterium sp.]
MEIQPSSTSFFQHPFDGMAEFYDADFTRTPLGRRKRALVHRYLETIVQPDWNVLELNCGTGEDALWLSRRAKNVMATDISAKMLEVAEAKIRENGVENVAFNQMGIEDLWEESSPSPQISSQQFNLVFSNFDGLNCLQNIAELPTALNRLLSPNGEAIFVLMSRFCALETVAELLRGNLLNAFQRSRGESRSIHIGNDLRVDTWFHPTRKILQLFRQSGFHVKEVRAIGLTTPPTSLRDFYHRHIRTFQRFDKVEERLSPYYPFNRVGDHLLVHIRKSI